MVKHFIEDIFPESLVRYRNGLLRSLVKHRAIRASGLYALTITESLENRVFISAKRNSGFGFLNPSWISKLRKENRMNELERSLEMLRETIDSEDYIRGLEMSKDKSLPLKMALSMSGLIREYKKIPPGIKSINGQGVVWYSST